MIEYIDSHCHLDFSEFDDDRARVLESCLAQGVKTILVPGVEQTQWPRLERLCTQHGQLRFAVGIHPWWIAKNLDPLEDDGTRLSEKAKDFLSSEYCLAIGECGLDANIDVDMETQIAVLEWHLRLALEAQLPVILHCVKAHNPMLATLNKYEGLRGVVHAFSGSEELAQQYWRKGFYLGAGGVLSYERANKTRNAFKSLPLEAILLETDAPDMPLSGRQGQRNSPENIPMIAQTLASLKSCELNVVASATTGAFKKLFNTPD